MTTPESGLPKEVSDHHSVRIGILGHVGNENLGDESIIAAVIQNIRSRYPDAEIFGFTVQPADTEARHGITTYPIRRLIETQATDSTGDAQNSSDLKQSSRTPSLIQKIKSAVRKAPGVSAAANGLRAAVGLIPNIVAEISFLREARHRVRGLDLLIIAGSHQLNDFVGGAWSFPYTVLKWTFLAKRAGAKVVFLSLGAGPIDSWLGRTFIRNALSAASYRSYRDVTGKRVVDGLGVSTSDEVVPDLAFSLDQKVTKLGASTHVRPVIGINPMPLYTDYWHETDFNKYDFYVGKLAAFADGLVERGCEVHFIPTQLRVDPLVITDITKKMATATNEDYRESIVEPKTESLEDLCSALSNVDFMVATRYHGILLSLSLGKPVLAIAYHDKSRDLMEWLGLGDYVIDGDDFTPEKLREMSLALEGAVDSISNSLREQLPEFRSAVQVQYDRVFGLIES